MDFRILAAALIVVPSLASARPAVPGFYAEVGVGAAYVPNVKAKSNTYVLGPNTAVGTGTVDYDNGVDISAEFGGDVFPGSDLGWSIAYDQVKAKITSFRIDGLINGTPGSVTINPGIVEKSQVVTANLNYQLPEFVDMLEPYVGIGIGEAFVRNAQNTYAVSATLGARAYINDWAYIGARYRYFHLGETTDDTGVTYKPSDIHTLTGTFGMKF